MFMKYNRLFRNKLKNVGPITPEMTRTLCFRILDMKKTKGNASLLNCNLSHYTKTQFQDTRICFLTTRVANLS